MDSKAVIFDMDGVLVLTNQLKAEAHVTTVQQFGGKVDVALYRQVIGQSHDVVRSIFINAGHISVAPEQYTRTYRLIYDEFLKTRLAITPGIPALLHTLWEREFLLAVVSSSHQRAVDMILEKANWSVYFAVKVTSDDITHQKPAPDGYFLALSKLGIQANRAIVFEDTTAGIEAAKTANLSVIAVRHALNDYQDLSKANHIIESFVDDHEIMELIDKQLIMAQESI